MNTIQSITHEPTQSLIKTNIPLADKNWFKTGGAARWFANPTNAQEFSHALHFARENNLEIFILGEGANILISDEGFDGLVIQPSIKNTEYLPITDTEILVTAGSGVSMPDLILDCLDHNVLGLEEFSGIPGTVGGSVFINLHYFQFLLAHFLVSAQVVEKSTGAILQVDNAWFNFGYNFSKLHENNHFLVSATFKLTKASDIQTAFARGRRQEIIRHRASRYPQSHTCGSFFRNFHENEVSIESNGKKLIFVAYYLDKIGVKGQLTVGDAIVSYQHANMLVNRGKATSSDLINLARAMQQLVRDHFGITPQPECRLIGFKEYPLL